MPRFARLMMVTAAALALGGCLFPTGFHAVTDALQQPNAEIRRLGRAAMGGDKQAQLELGIRYEEGVGVPVDLAAAESLYRMAAEPVSGTIYIYTPGVGRSPGGVTPVTLGPDTPGLGEAAKRRERLRSARRAREAGGRGN